MIGTPGIRWCDCRWRFLVNGPLSPLNRPLFKFIHFCMRADIVLGCTEFPLIIKPPDVEVPLFDTTRLHSQMAVDFILGKQGLARVRPDQ